MRDAFAEEVAAQGDHLAIRAILEDVCRLTQMGFAAVARVTEERWIACQIVDKIEFGLVPGDELELKTTICNDIRQTGTAVVIDDVAGSDQWRTHPIPILYGFKSYVSVPVCLADGSFFGTLCAIDPAPRALSTPALMAALEACARNVADILSRRPTATDAAPYAAGRSG